MFKHQVFVCVFVHFFFTLVQLAKINLKVAGILSLCAFIKAQSRCIHYKTASLLRNTHFALSSPS